MLIINNKTSHEPPCQHQKENKALTLNTLMLSRHLGGGMKQNNAHSIKRKREREKKNGFVARCMLMIKDSTRETKETKQKNYAQTPFRHEL